ncbi:unnamed protein product [Clostridium phage HM2]|nr:unnamed protein product [Clostridium phage HM2]
MTFHIMNWLLLQFVPERNLHFIISLVHLTLSLQL